MNRHLLVLAATATLTMFACDNTAKHAQETAEKAQTEAQKKIDTANAEATNKITSAELDAKKKTAEATEDFTKARDEYRHTTQEHLDSVDKDLAELDAKAKKATGPTKADLDKRLVALHAQRVAFGEDVKTIETTTVMTWDATKAHLDKEWEKLKEAVDHAK